MTRFLGILSATAVMLFVFAMPAAADTKVVVKKTHICCPRCEKVVGDVLKKAGVEGSASKDDGSIQFTAKDDPAAQKVLDELAAAGFHGTVDHEKLKIKDDSGAKAGKVTSLKVKGLHNCCGQCNTAIKKAVKAVAGVESDDAKVNSAEMTVQGSFDAAELIKALNAAGFHAKVAE
uniref:HMA domain-containing protein n=1 Tax=Schlesneria paludicola TaxID=360056 RepID=A0A7C2NWP1_9PLAN